VGSRLPKLFAPQDLPRPLRACLVAALVLVPAAMVAGLAPAPAGAQDAPRFQAKITDANRVGLTVTNYGFFGNNFNSRAPSFEYPLGDGFEHMSRAGVWIGGHAISDTGAVTRVSQGAVDNAQGSNQLTDTEFTPLPGAMLERSRIKNSKNYSAAAVSDQDFVADFSDEPPHPGSTYSSEAHVPLDVDVELQTYAFGLDAAADFVVLHFTITNQGPPLRDAYVGLYSQLASGNKNAYPGWPPSGGAPPGSWYYKTYETWIDSLAMVTEHYCATVNALGQPDSITCNYAYCPPWVASKFLGVRAGALALPVPDSLQVNVRFWNYAPGDTTRDEDSERYGLMAQRGVDDPSQFWAGKGQNLSPIELISVGPFAELDPDSSVSVDFAFVGGLSLPALVEHAAFARFAFQQNYRLPAPPPSPHLHVRARDHALELLWDATPETVPDPTSPAPGGLDFEGYRVYAGTDRNHLALVSQFDKVDTTGFNTGLAPALLPGGPVIEGGDTLVYHAIVPALRDGFKEYVAVTSFDTGDEQIGPLESGLNENKTLAVPNPAPGERGGGVTVYPNPYHAEAAWDAGALVRDHYLWFANLPAHAHLSIFTLSGDLVFDTEFDGANDHGESARGLFDPRQDVDTEPPTLSGTSYAWDLISRSGQAVASGLYLYTVQDRTTGKVERGKFLIVKSDVESFR
jgi:hypothetical protein